MARIAGVDLPPNKRLVVALTYIFGIGSSLSKKILADAGVNPDQKASELDDEDTTKLRKLIEEDYTVEGDLRQEVSLNVKRLMEIGSYRGFRHRRGLPVRGQRTHTNARTRKGKKRGAVAARRKATAKT